MLFDRDHPRRTCIVLGGTCSDEGGSKRNRRTGHSCLWSGGRILGQKWSDTPRRETSAAGRCSKRLSRPALTAAANLGWPELSMGREVSAALSKVVANHPSHGATAVHTAAGWVLPPACGRPPRTGAAHVDASASSAAAASVIVTRPRFSAGADARYVLSAGTCRARYLASL